MKTFTNFSISNILRPGNVESCPPAKQSLSFNNGKLYFHVSCGGGFTVAILSTGEVATWGMWSHGRLGLGAPPEAKLNRGARSRKGTFGRQRKKVVRYQLKPKIIPQMKNAIKVDFS